MATYKELLAVSKATRESLEAFKRGVYLEGATARSIEDLKRQVCLDRLRLSKRFLRASRSSLRSRPRQHRQSISRGYYAMYHAVRAMVFNSHGGDDFQEHSELPKHLPGDFPGRTSWENDIKEARLRRNEADYDPYPLNEASFRKSAVDIAAKAAKLLRVVSTYLKARGVTI